MNKRIGILKHSESLILFTIWIAIFAAPLFVFQLDDSIIWVNVFFAWTGLIPFFILFIINHFLLVPSLLFNGKKITYLVSCFLLVLLFSSTLYYLEGERKKKGPPQQEEFQQRQPRPDHSELDERFPPPPQPGRNPLPFPPFINSFIVSILIIGFDSGLRMMVRSSNLEQEKTLLEKENVQNQLAFLRNQVSPHFFMNTLNNIHALIDIDTNEAKESIIKLSKLMRHLLYTAEEELVPLEKEIEFISSYINLMKLRFSDKVKINLNIPANLPDKNIPPLLFTSFVENAFKHGISYQKPSFIDIQFSYENNYLTLIITNSNSATIKKEEDSGIGIENSRKRLDLIYGSDYSFTIADNTDEFNLILKIPI
jgi:hypothetical protein